jgi:hypothetical protein
MDLSRRKIIKSFALVAGATATGLIPGASLLMAAAPSPLNFESEFGKKRMNAFLIGAGNRGMYYAKHALKQKGKLSIVGVAELIGERREAASNFLNLESEHCYAHWNEVMPSQKIADIAIIAASKNYYEVCEAALQSGYHVWVDRPASMDYDEIISLNQLAEKQKRALLYCYIHEGNFQFMSHKHFEKRPEVLFL